LSARARGLSFARDAGAQGVAVRGADRRSLRGPEPRLRVPAGRGVRVMDGWAGGWRLWLDTVPHSGAWNMAADSTLLSAAQRGQAWLRLYQWNPACLSFG